MNMLRNRLVGAGLAVLLGAAATALPGAARPAGAEEIRRVGERLIPFAPGGEISIDDKNGRLVVEAWARHEVRVQVTRVVRAGDREKAEGLMKDLQTEIEVHSDRIDIQSQFPRRQETLGLWDILGRKVAALQINYYVQVPEESNLVLRTSNGEVRVSATSGSVEARTTNGDIVVENVKGDVDLLTTNGEVRVNDLAGAVVAHTTNGSIVAEMRKLPPRGSVELGTTNGNVEAYFANDLRATLTAATTNGQVSIGFPIVREGVMTSKTIRGTIQGGGAKISLGTTNGNVEVRRLGERRP
jgi:putative adhesin